jgi:hypothetical protein
MSCVAAVDTGDLITVAAPWEGPKERDLWEDRGIYGRMGPESVFGRFAGGCVEWIQLAQDRGRWQALVNAVMNFRVLALRN